MQPKVSHYISVAPESDLVTRARCVTFDRTDDVSFFVNDRIIGALCVPAGRGPELCAQMGLVDRSSSAISLDTIRAQFEQALNGE